VQLGAAIGKLPNYHTWQVQDLGMASIKDPGVREEAVRRGVLILTFDKDFTDPVDFRICTHPGVVLIQMSSQATSHILPRLTRWLRSSHSRKIKHAVTLLRDEVALITTKKGLEPEIRYYTQDSDR